jgi:hypothetical protein
MLKEYWGYYHNDLQYNFEDGGNMGRYVHEFLFSRKNEIINAVSDSLSYLPSNVAKVEINNYITVARSCGLRYQSNHETEYYAYFIATFIGMFIDDYCFLLS